MPALLGALFRCEYIGQELEEQMISVPAEGQQTLPVLMAAAAKTVLWAWQVWFGTPV